MTVVRKGVIDPLLHSLERCGALKAETRLVNGRRRVYYRGMAKGRHHFHDLRTDAELRHLWFMSAVDGMLTTFKHAAPLLLRNHPVSSDDSSCPPTLQKFAP